MNNWTFLSLKGCWAVLVPPLQYSSIRRRKYKATQARFLMAIFLGVVPWAEVSKAWIILTGIGGSLSFLLSSLITYVTNHLKSGHIKIHPSKSFTGDNRQPVLKVDTLPDDLEFPPILPESTVKIYPLSIKITWNILIPV